jgi:hypothetical protein
MEVRCASNQTIEQRGKIMQGLIVIGYIGLGIVQWFAMVDGIAHWTGMSTFFAGVVSFFLAGIPLLGTILGFIGAIEVWGWAWWQAGLLFFGTFGVIIALGGAAIIGEALQNRRRGIS